VDILQPGPGVGGHCIAVDPWFIVSADPVNSKLIRQARDVNENKTAWVIENISSEARALNVENPVVACLGLAFKPDVDDLRESPAALIAKSLVELGFNIICVEPNVDEHDDFKIVDLESAIQCCDLAAILVGHKEFKSTDGKALLQKKKAIDFCGLMNAEPTST
jgi:UDP-N-acetyl-D-mannosaminuronic acid dehydrogenase